MAAVHWTKELIEPLTCLFEGVHRPEARHRADVRHEVHE